VTFNRLCLFRRLCFNLWMACVEKAVIPTILTTSLEIERPLIKGRRKASCLSRLLCASASAPLAVWHSSKQGSSVQPLQHRRTSPNISKFLAEYTEETRVVLQRKYANHLRKGQRIVSSSRFGSSWCDLRQLNGASCRLV
jgi:hypothetical protein